MIKTWIGKKKFIIEIQKNFSLILIIVKAAIHRGTIFPTTHISPGAGMVFYRGIHRDNRKHPVQFF